MDLHVGDFVSCMPVFCHDNEVAMGPRRPQMHGIDLNQIHGLEPSKPRQGQDQHPANI